MVREVVKPLFVTPHEAAQMLSISRSKVYVLLRSGKIPYRRIGSAIRIPVGWLEQMAAEAAKQVEPRH